MPSGYFGGWFLHHLLKGRSPSQVERGFWIVVAWLIALPLWFLLVARLTNPEAAAISMPCLVMAALGVQAWRARTLR